MQMLWWCSWAQTVHSWKASSSAYCEFPDLLRVKYHVEKGLGRLAQTRIWPLGI